MERVIAVVLTWALRGAVIDDIVLDLWYLNSHFLPLFSLSLSRGASAVSNNGPCSGAGLVWRGRSDSSYALVHHWGPHLTRNALCLMRVKGQRAVCLEGAGSPRHTQSLTLALYLNQASGSRLPLSKAILLTSSRSLISFCAMLFVSLSLNRGRGQC